MYMGFLIKFSTKSKIMSFFFSLLFRRWHIALFTEFASICICTNLVQNSRSKENQQTYQKKINRLFLCLDTELKINRLHRLV